MPQPLSKVKPDANIRVGAHDLPPNLSILIVRTIAAWSYNDHLFSTLLTGVLKGELQTVSAMYQALVSGEAKKAALLAAVNAARPDDADLVRAVFSATKASRNQRHAFAHHLICVADELPDCLVVVDPTCLIAPDIQFREMLANGQWEPKFTKVGNAMKMETPPIPVPDRSRMFVYTKRDLEEAATNAAACTEVIKALLRALCSNPPDAESRRLLLQEPRIQREIAKLSKQKPRKLQPEQHLQPPEK